MTPESVPGLKVPGSAVSRWLPFLVPLESSPEVSHRAEVSDRPRATLGGSRRSRAPGERRRRACGPDAEAARISASSSAV